MSVNNSTNETKDNQDRDNSIGVTLFSLIISITIGAFTLLKSFFDNVTALISSAVFIVILVILIRIASSHGILRALGRWLSGK